MSVRYVVLETLDRGSCTFCGAVLEPGLVGARLDRRRTAPVCEKCLVCKSEPLGLVLQGVSLLRQAAAYFMGGCDDATRDLLGQHLLQFAIASEQRAFGRWPRRHPVARIDCEHCLAHYFPSLPKETLKKVHTAQRAVRVGRTVAGPEQQMLEQVLRTGMLAGLGRDEFLEGMALYEDFLDTVDELELCLDSGKLLYVCGEAYPIDMAEAGGLAWFLARGALKGL